MKLPDTVIDQAVAWQVLMVSGMATDADREACRQWCAMHPDHALAWQRIAGFGSELKQLPSAVAHATLGQERVSRRMVLRSLALTAGGGMLLAAGSAHWSAGPELPWRQGTRIATGVGERRHQRLADGSELTLNAESALDVLFSDRQRLLSLAQGDAFVQAAGPAAAGDAGPLRVDTAHGSIRALGTRFMVRQRGDMSRVAVYEGVVEVATPRSPAAMRVPAGHALRFGAGGPLALEQAGADDMAWLDGRLVARSMRLADLLAELGHYRHGWLRCDEAAAALKVSGVFSLNNSDQALAVLARTLPVRVRRVTPYWVNVSLS